MKEVRELVNTLSAPILTEKDIATVARKYTELAAACNLPSLQVLIKGQQIEEANVQSRQGSVVYWMHNNAIFAKDTITHQSLVVDCDYPGTEGCGLCQLNQTLYRSGGAKDTSGEGVRSTMHSFTIDMSSPTPVTKRVLRSMIEPRAGHTLVALRNCIYSVGGYYPHEPITVCERYDVDTNIWRLIPSLNCARSKPTVVAFNERQLYCVGGAYARFSVEFYDCLEDAKWVCLKVDRLRTAPGVPGCLISYQVSNKEIIHFDATIIYLLDAYAKTSIENGTQNHRSCPCQVVPIMKHGIAYFPITLSSGKWDSYSTATRKVTFYMTTELNTAFISPEEPDF